ncbi:MAG: LPP20 family lipoprotein [Nitrosomonadales bacterium]|nr:LPP20 family lipoprotein [Nitrosomonadales bacterium]
MMRLSVCLVATLLLLGCAGAGQSAGSGKVVSGAPAWVLNPEKPGHTSVVASAPRQDWGGRAAQFRVAEMKARQELAQMVRVRVESTNQSRVEDRAGAVSRSGDVETRLQSSVDLILEKARVVEEWSDPQSGELYIWLVTPN